MTDKVGFEETPEVFRVIEQITISFNKKKHTGAVFLDVGSQGIQQSLASRAPPQADRSRISDRTGENCSIPPAKQDF
jgi:hypothetical protein